jgi:hypothetical protein
MKTLAEYNDFVKAQDALKERALAVANLLNDIHPKKYEMYSQEAESIRFYEDEITVETGATFRGSYDSTYCDFKADYLFLTHEQIIERATKEFEDDKVSEIVKKQEDAKKKADKELEKEKAEFARLKEKFG